MNFRNIMRIKKKTLYENYEKMWKFMTTNTNFFMRSNKIIRNEILSQQSLMYEKDESP